MNEYSLAPLEQKSSEYQALGKNILLSLLTGGLESLSYGLSCGAGDGSTGRS
jgi:hypothetical protein